MRNGVLGDRPFRFQSALDQVQSALGTASRDPNGEARSQLRTNVPARVDGGMFSPDSQTAQIHRCSARSHGAT